MIIQTEIIDNRRLVGENKNVLYNIVQILEEMGSEMLKDGKWTIMELKNNWKIIKLVHRNQESIISKLVEFNKEWDDKRRDDREQDINRRMEEQLRKKGIT
jgi:hypothetical protein